MRRRDRHRDAAAEASYAKQRLHDVRMKARDAFRLRRAWQLALQVSGDWGWLEQERNRKDKNRERNGVPEHDRLPTRGRQTALEDRGPYDAGHILAGRNQRNGGPPTAIEPSTDIDQKGRIESAVSQQADHQPVADIERRHGAQRGYRKSPCDHGYAERDGCTHADAIREPAHKDAAGPCAYPNE